MKEYELITEAKKRGYRKGTPLNYNGMLPGIDSCEGDEFEIDEYGNLLAFAKPKHERKGFDDWRHDTIYQADSKKWTEIATRPVKDGINL
jgi:hypothetical protein